MPTCINKIKRTCRLCLMSTERHKRYELFVKSEVENCDPFDKDAGAGGECQQDAFSDMILYEKVEYCCGIRLAPKAQLPSKICGKCFYMIHMWFNFRQMCCNSQIFFSSQTSIKLEDDSMARNSPVLQKMRCQLLRAKEKKEEIEFITPDVIKDGDNKVNCFTEKVGVGESEILIQKEKGFGVYFTGNTDFKEKNTSPKSNDEESENCDSQKCADEESASSVEEEINACNKTQEESYNSNKEEEDCLVEICVEESILKAAHSVEEVSNIGNSKENSLIESNVSLDGDKEDCNYEICAEEEFNHASPNEEGETNYSSSTENVANMGSGKGVKKSSNRYEEEIDETGHLLHEEVCTTDLCDNNDYESELDPKEDDDYIFDTSEIAGDFVSKSPNNSDCNQDIAENINSALAGSDSEYLEENNKQSKPENKRVRIQKPRNSKTVRRSNSNESVVHDKETIQNENLFPRNTEYKKLEDPDKYICNICGNIYKSKVQLKQHMRTHSKEKPYICELCKKSFRTSAFLKCHMSVHTGERRHKCRYCNLQYTDASSRHRHEKTHTHSPNYTCNICDKRFMYKTVLRRHVKLHSGEKLYSCGVCNTSFALPHHLKSHIGTTAHREKQSSYEALGFKIVFETRQT